MRWPKYWSFSFSIIPSKEIPGLISFRMDWLDLLAVQSSLLQRGDLSSTDTLGYVSIGTEEGEHLITERKLGVLGKFSPEHRG